MDRFRALLEEVLPGVEVAVSRHPGHEYELADRALDEGVELLIAAGGDGTWSHVADRIVASGRRDVVMGLLPSGTGNDFGRNIGLAYRNQEDAVRRLGGSRILEVDVGRVCTPSRPAETGKTGSSEERPRHFLNVVGVGFDVAVVDAAAGARFLRGEPLYKITALQQLFRFQGLPLAVGPDEPAGAPSRHLMVTITNGEYFGGGFPIAPGAGVEDGQLHACVIADAKPLRRMSLFNLAGKGRHSGEAEVRIIQASRFHLRFESPPRFEVDGDLFTATGHELELEVLPGALKILG
jgi:diacylglycerol kinase (ATP)